ncbi:Phosphoribosyl-ATP pyrophosphatase [uncultured Alphaproteobacteria bacterium]|jgi:phosphoribosyl-ATP pyrophosphohydrolase|uniref:Phosphoribosyl-ATP pyrophosphatase n=1 Tax=uncultured Alphaproteobacteria bacterium TaxID=91750 RepID=A0A212KBD4_9PROT|nr:Phosphoribosyl-ATP pyrophosphatase [uncultured Alphaproteobacteria bacterium]
MSGHPLEDLYAVISARKGADPTESYTAKLFSRGRAKITQKLGEEAVELVIAGCAEPDKMVSESADLIYHMLVLWADAGIAPEAVWAELARRAGTSGLAEKASRKKD